MGQDSVAAVYAEVIKDVTKNLEQFFHQESIDHTLTNLTQLWVSRLLNARVLSPETDTRELHQLAQNVLSHPHPHSSFAAPNVNVTSSSHGYHPSHYPQAFQQNFPVRPSHQLANPAGRTMPQPQTQVPVPHYPAFDYSQQQEPYLNHAYLQSQNRPTSAASLPTIANLGHRSDNPSAVGRPRPNLARPQTTYPGAYPPQPPYNLPQNDGAEDELLPTKEVDEILHQQIERGVAEEAVIEFEIPEKLRKGRASKKIPQVDGEGDDDDEDPEEGGDSEQENEGGNEESLNSSLDSDGEEQEEVRDLVVCLFDKVTRARTKWRCTLKDGIMNLNGKDYLFHRNTGEFEW